MTRVTILGANGQLGTDLVAACRAAGHEVAALTHADVEVADAASVRAALDAAPPAVVLNTTAFHNVPRCEEEPERAFAVNAVGALNVARAAAEHGALNVYFSTDYVFDGARREPYAESDLPNPLNVYAASKLAGEHLTLANSPRGAVLRVSGIYGATPCRAKGASFVSKMVELAGARPEVRVVTDEVLTPTPTTAIAAKTVELLERKPSGVYHLTCEGHCSWFEFAQEIFTALELATPLHPTTTAEFPSPVRRPTWSVLANTRLAETGLDPMPHWRDALLGFLAEQYELLDKSTAMGSNSLNRR